MNRIIKTDLYRHEGRSGIIRFFEAWSFRVWIYIFTVKVQQHKKFSVPGVF